MQHKERFFSDHFPFDHVISEKRKVYNRHMENVLLQDNQKTVLHAAQTPRTAVVVHKQIY